MLTVITPTKISYNDLRLKRLAIVSTIIITSLGFSVPLGFWSISDLPDVANWHALIIEGTFAADLAILFYYLQQKRVIAQRARELRRKRFWIEVIVEEVRGVERFYQTVIKFFDEELARKAPDLAVPDLGERIGALEDYHADITMDMKSRGITQLDIAALELRTEIDPKLYVDLIHKISEIRSDSLSGWRSLQITEDTKTYEYVKPQYQHELTAISDLIDRLLKESQE